LLQGNGKQVRHIHFLSNEIEKINSKGVIEVLQEAILLNEKKYNSNKLK